MKGSFTNDWVFKHMAMFDGVGEAVLDNRSLVSAVGVNAFTEKVFEHMAIFGGMGKVLLVNRHPSLCSGCGIVFFLWGLRVVMRCWHFVKYSIF